MQEDVAPPVLEEADVCDLPVFAREPEPGQREYEDVVKAAKPFWLSRFFVKYYLLIIMLTIAA